MFLKVFTSTTLHPITPNTAKTGRSQYKCGFGCFEVVLININATKANDRAEIRYKLKILTLSEVKHPPSVVEHTITNKLDEIVIATKGEINQLIITRTNLFHPIPPTPTPAIPEPINAPITV
jgi:hypothetical protein